MAGAKLATFALTQNSERPRRKRRGGTAAVMPVPQCARVLRARLINPVATAQPPGPYVPVLTADWVASLYLTNRLCRSALTVIPIDDPFRNVRPIAYLFLK